MSRLYSAFTSAPTGGPGAAAMRSTGTQVFAGPDRENDLKIFLSSVHRRYSGFVVEGFTVSRTANQISLDVELAQTAKGASKPRWKRSR